MLWRSSRWAVPEEPVTDRWGIDARYIDANDDEQQVPHASITRLREIIGEPDTVAASRRPIVVRTGESVHLGRGELRLEDGTTIEVTSTLLVDVPTGYHSFTTPEGDERRVIVS